MKKIGLLIAVGFLISIDLAASNQCSCQEVKKKTSNQTEFIHFLEKSELNFTATIETKAVRGVQSARYYYCDNDHGFLVVKLHDTELIYKEVPLQTWFEFKFADSSNSYYKEEIKYKYITT